MVASFCFVLFPPVRWKRRAKEIAYFSIATKPVQLNRPRRHGRQDIMLTFHLDGFFLNHNIRNRTFV